MPNPLCTCTLCRTQSSPSPSAPPPPYACMNLQEASCQELSFNNKPQAARMTYSPLSSLSPFRWVMCLLIPHIFSGARVLCSAGNMGRNSNDSASWCGYCRRVTMGASWISVHLVISRRRRGRLCLSLLWCVLTFVQMKAGRNGPLEAPGLSAFLVCDCDC